MKPPAIAFPKLPARLMAPGGEVLVRIKRQPKVDKQDVWGSWDESTRVIEIDGTAPPAHQWHTLYHELTHVALADAGADELMTEDLVEMLCDAVSTARMRERFG